MKEICKQLILFLFIFVANVAVADPIQKAIKKSGIREENLSLLVSSDNQQKPIYELNSKKLMIPASLTKIITATCVLKELGTGFKFETSLYYDGNNLYLKGGGDPSFVSESMWNLVNNFLRANILEIKGDIIVDDSRFDQIRFGDDRQDRRVDRAYDAPLGAMSMNWNAVNVYFRAGDKIGEKARVIVDFESDYLRVENRTQTVKSGTQISVERKAHENGDLIIVSGSVAKGDEEKVIFKSITKPDLWSGYNLLKFLKERGIVVKGKIRTGKTTKNSEKVATIESKPVSQIVMDMAKWSNNYVADMLVKNLAAEKKSIPAQMNDGIAILNSCLKSISIRDSYVLQNPAGFTRENKLSAEQITSVLKWSYQSFNLSPEFIGALPISGTDGTLKKRMKEDASAGWIRAKTGLLDGVVGLAGFAGRKSGAPYVFAFIYNGAPGGEEKARNLFDAIASMLVRNEIN